MALNHNIRSKIMHKYWKTIHTKVLQTISNNQHMHMRTSRENSHQLRTNGCMYSFIEKGVWEGRQTLFWKFDFITKRNIGHYEDISSNKIYKLID